jgi:hypothetical protein
MQWRRRYIVRCFMDARLGRATALHGGFVRCCGLRPEHRAMRTGGRQGGLLCSALGTNALKRSFCLSPTSLAACWVLTGPQQDHGRAVVAGAAAMRQWVSRRCRAPGVLRVTGFDMGGFFGSSSRHYRRGCGVSLRPLFFAKALLSRPFTELGRYRFGRTAT